MAKKFWILLKNKELHNFDQFKINKIINKFLLTGDKFVPELHLKRPGFTYRACRPFTKHCKRIQKFRETGYLKHLYRNEWDKACFVYDAAYSENKDVAKRIISDNILKDRAYDIARNHGYDRYQRALARVVYKYSDTKTGLGATETSKAGISVDEHLKNYITQ